MIQKKYFNDINQRLDRFLSKKMNDTPRSLIFKLIRKNKVLVNEQVINSPGYFLSAGDQISILDNKVSVNVNQDKFIIEKPAPIIDLDIVFENKSLLIINKLDRVSVHGFLDSLDNQVRWYLKKLINPNKTFIPTHVHRLDRNTTGLLIYAKKHETCVLLNKEIKNISKTYYALVKGNLRKKIFQEGYLKKVTESMQVTNSKTKSLFFSQEITPIINENNFTFIKIKLITGKKHQIRAGLAHLGHPIVGDKKYGYEDKNILIFLHARKIDIPLNLVKLLDLKEKVFYAKFPNHWEEFLKDKKLNFIYEELKHENKK